MANITQKTLDFLEKFPGAPIKFKGNQKQFIRKPGQGGFNFLTPIADEAELRKLTEDKVVTAPFVELEESLRGEFEFAQAPLPTLPPGVQEGDIVDGQVATPEGKFKPAGVNFAGQTIPEGSFAEGGGKIFQSLSGQLREVTNPESVTGSKFFVNPNHPAFKNLQFGDPITLPSSAPEITGIEGLEDNVVIPEPEGPEITEAFLQSSTQNAQLARTALDQQIKSERDRLAEERKSIEERIKTIESQQKDALGDVDKLTQPFRAELEAKRRQEFFVNENFNQSQKLINELDGLLTGIQAKVEAQRAKTGLAVIREPRITATIEEAKGRALIIQSVLAARSGQIQQGLQFIDREIGSITADKNDRLKYFQSLLNFYSSQLDVEGDKAFNLSKQDQGFLNDQISLLEQDLVTSQSNVDYIKSLMTDVNTAQFIADAGISLTDPISVINEKMSTHSYNLEVREIISKQEQAGLRHIPTPQDLAGIPLDEIKNVIDSRNVIHKFRIPQEEIPAPSLTPSPTQITETRERTIENLLGVGLEPAIMTTKGALTKGNADKILTRGVPLSVMNIIWDAIKDGTSLDEIRNNFRTQLMDSPNNFSEEKARQIGFGYLDNFMQALQETGGAEGLNFDDF